MITASRRRGGAPCAWSSPAPRFTQERRPGGTGAAWFFVQGVAAALALREAHIVASRAGAVMLLLRLAGVALHLLEFARV
jgi:hypothetical protein